MNWMAKLKTGKTIFTLDKELISEDDIDNNLIEKLIELEKKLGRPITIVDYNPFSDTLPL